MPRKRVPTQSTLPYHVSARCINREWFRLPMKEVWSLMGDYLYLIKFHYNLNIHAFVLMNNHFHLLTSAPEANISPALNYFMRETSREITRLSGRINQTYGGRNHKTLISMNHHYMNTYKYIYRNPVRAGLCEYVEEYEFSTLNGLVGLNHLVVPLAEDTLLFKPSFDQSTLNWLNVPSNPDHEDEIRRALKKRIFKLGKTKNKTKSALETELI
jgi:putative transposase